MSRSFYSVTFAFFWGALFGSLTAVCGSDAQAPIQPRVYQITTGKNSQYELQNILVQAIPGDVIEFGVGKFTFQRQIDLATDNITLRGQGMDQTILSFAGQASGGQGIEATGNNLLLADFAVEDTAGNAIKVVGARNVTFRGVRTEWTGEPKASNGAYGLYPVQCTNVLMDSCVAIGASDSRDLRGAESKCDYQELSGGAKRSWN